jgi:beta-lactamase superfamily II metal-dependent hydrolase
MYDVGFGDAFVLFFPDGAATRTMLLDCGSIHAGDLGSIDTVAKRIVADIEAETGAKHVDVVVASHRHKDHVSGFASSVWDQVDVGEVWLPWTEDPKDPDATRIRNKQASLALALTGNASGRTMPALVTELAVNALSNASAMDTLHGGFKSRVVPEPRYLPEKERVKATFKSPQLPGVLVRVLGPSRTESVIRDMDPPSGESYLAALGSSRSAAAGNEDAPFSTGIRRNAYQRAGAAPLHDRAEKDLSTVGMLDEYELAATLESAVNGTSLMLMLDFGKARLLLPGDAQWGTWKAALDDTEWGPLFATAGFYKIGHHGSHNATPLGFVEHHMKQGIAAMASVTPVAQWKNIPRAPLLAALAKKKVSVARSDQPKKAPASRFRRATDNAWIETWLPI